MRSRTNLSMATYEWNTTDATAPQDGPQERSFQRHERLGSWTGGIFYFPRHVRGSQIWRESVVGAVAHIHLPSRHPSAALVRHGPITLFPSSILCLENLRYLERIAWMCVALYFCLFWRVQPSLIGKETVDQTFTSSPPLASLPSLSD